MATKIIDASLHGSAIPTGYTGPGTLAASCRQAAGVRNRVAGAFTSTNDAVQVNCGFRPISAKVVNLTDGITWEWQYGFGATQSIKAVLGGSLAVTLDTGTAFTVSTDSAGNHTMTFSATAMGNSKSIVFLVED